MDGTLVRTEELWMAAEENTMAAFGGHWDAQDQAVAVGGPVDRVLEYMAERVGRPVDEVGAKIVGEIEHLMRTEHIPWMPGARELHRELTAAGVPQALVSNSWRGLMDTALQELDTSFDVVIAGDEVERPKPDPFPYLHACERLGVDPRRRWCSRTRPRAWRQQLARAAGWWGYRTSATSPRARAWCWWTRSWDSPRTVLRSWSAKAGCRSVGDAVAQSVAIARSTLSREARKAATGPPPRRPGRRSRGRTATGRR